MCIAWLSTHLASGVPNLLHQVLAILLEGQNISGDLNQERVQLPLIPLIKHLERTE